MTKEYRKIWEKANGKIPKDKDGRSYEIHHINGDHDDNRLENLKLVTIQEHFDIHYSQEDFGACKLISKRMRLDVEANSKLLSELATLLNKQRIDNGTHHWLKDNRGDLDDRLRQSNTERIADLNTRKLADGTHTFLDPEIKAKNAEVLKKRPDGSSLGKEVQDRKVRNGTHHFLGGELQRKNSRKAVEDGTCTLLGGEIQREQMLLKHSNGNHPSQLKYSHPDHPNEPSKAKGHWGNFCKKRGINFEEFKNELVI